MKTNFPEQSRCYFYKVSDVNLYRLIFESIKIILLAY